MLNNQSARKKPTLRERAQAEIANRAPQRRATACEKSGPIAHFRHGALVMVTRRHLACYCGRPVDELDLRVYRESPYRG